MTTPREQLIEAIDPDDLPPHPGCGDPDCLMDHDWWPGTTREQADALIAKRKREAKR
jgi:hypothetical protein